MLCISLLIALLFKSVPKEKEESIKTIVPPGEVILPYSHMKSRRGRMNANRPPHASALAVDRFRYRLAKILI